MRGPIDYIVVAFEGNNFKCEILKELAKASEGRIIKVLAIAVVSRNKDGDVSAVKITDDETMKIMDGLDLDSALISPEDIEEVGEILEDNSSAGLLIIEQLWAKGLKQAILNAKGTLIAEGRIHPEASKELSKKGA